MYFYLSIGSNLEPEHNALKIVSALAQHFGSLILYPFCHTEAVNLHSKRPFLNALALIESPLPAEVIKQILVGIESALGRDRNDPERSTKDRPADIDILGGNSEPSLHYFQSSREPYIQNVLQGERIADLRAFGLPATQRPTAVDFDRGTGHIVVIENGLDGLKDWQKAALGL